MFDNVEEQTQDPDKEVDQIHTMEENITQFEKILGGMVESM